MTSTEIDGTVGDSRPGSVTEGDKFDESYPSDGRIRFTSITSNSKRVRNVVGGFVAIGILCFAGAATVPTAREPLLTLSGIGFFASVLAYGLTGGRFIDDEDGKRVYGTCAANLEAIAAAMGSSDERIYVPVSEAGENGVRLLVPADVDRFVQGKFVDTIVDPHGRGLLLYPIGGALFEEFEQALREPVASSPESLAEQLTDALCRRFEFVIDADSAVYADEGEATIAISGSAFGPVDKFDHPVASFLAVGFAVGLNRQISLAVTPDTDGERWLATCQWDEGVNS